jgi:hypothetical protein
MQIATEDDEISVVECFLWGEYLSCELLPLLLLSGEIPDLLYFKHGHEYIIRQV